MYPPPICGNREIKNGSFRLIFLRVAAEFTGREKYKTPSRAHGCLRRAGKREPSPNVRSLAADVAIR